MTSKTNKTKAELQEELDVTRQLLKTLTESIKGGVTDKPKTAPVQTSDTTEEDKLRAQLKNVTEQLDKSQSELAVISAERDAQQKAIDKIEAKLLDLSSTVNNNVKQSFDRRNPWFVGTVIALIVVSVFCFFFIASEIRNRLGINQKKQAVILKQSMANISYNSRPLNTPEQWSTLAAKLTTLAESNPSTLQVALGEIRFYLELVDHGNTWEAWRKNVGTKLTEEVNKDPSKLQSLLKEAAEGLSR
jgi:hypothetical protein